MRTPKSADEIIYVDIDYITEHYHSIVYTSSAVLATASKPTYAKKTVAEPASIPSTPKGKYLLMKNRQVLSNKRPNQTCMRKWKTKY